MQSKISDLFVIRDPSLDMWQMLMHCAIRLNLARLDAERRHAKYDRDQIVFDYFKRKSAANNTEGQRMIGIISKRKKQAGYAFDQYFLLFHGFKPSPDASELGQVVREGLEKHGYAAAV